MAADMFASKDQAEREEGREVYALTYKESRYIIRIGNIISEVQSSYIATDESGKVETQSNADSKAAILQAFKNKRISRVTALALANRILSGKWYSLLIYGNQAALDEIRAATGFKGMVYFIECSDNKNGVIHPAEYPAFYSLREARLSPAQHRIAERDALGLTTEYKYLYSAELYILKDIIALCAEPERVDGEAGGYWKMKSSPMIAALALASPRTKRVDIIGDTVTLQSQNVAIYLTNETSRAVLRDINAAKLLDLVYKEAYQTGYKQMRFSFPLKEIMEAQGRTDEKTARKQYQKAIDLLDGIELKAIAGGDSRNVAVSQRDGGVHGGRVNFTVTLAFLEGLKSTKQVALYHPLMQKLPAKGNAYPFARAFMEQKRRNIGKDYGIENRLSVINLLSISTLPSIDRVPSGQAGQKIIEPFHKALDAIEEAGIFSYRFCHSNGIDLTDSELAQIDTDYILFASLYIEVKWFIEPDYTNLLEKKEQRKALAAAKAQQPRKRGRPRKNNT